MFRKDRNGQKNPPTDKYQARVTKNRRPNQKTTYPERYTAGSSSSRGHYVENREIHDYRNSGLSDEIDHSEFSPNQSTRYPERQPNHRPYTNGNYKNETKRVEKPIRQMGFKVIKSLLENEDLEDVMFQLNNNRKGYRELMESRDIKPDIVVLIMKLLAKICMCTFESSKITILETALRSNFAESLVTYISKICIQNANEKKFNEFFWNDPDDFWGNLISVAHTVNKIIPTSSCDVMIKILMAVKTYIPPIESTHAIHISDEVKLKIASLHEIAEKTSKEAERKRERRVEFDRVEAEPPNDFREIDIYPGVAEITHLSSPYLRRNIVDRPYDSINQYLDIQFRLLREDFVRPLREGICKYLADPKMRKNIDDIKIYPFVRFLSAENVNEQNCFRIQFNVHQKKVKPINYQHSRRFMFGSLLCFTCDHFASILFGKVVERDIKQLENGQLIVGFDVNVVLPTYLFDRDFLMVESSIFFEPYFQVLTVLKGLESDQFPMERYIIRVKTDSRPPNYILNIDPQYYTIEDETFWPLDWPDKKFYNFNESQERAFRAALTQEFTIIQGPPGTGKTFLGLKVARTLIENHSAWHKQSPLLVICFTNHALDQFLEGLLEVTDKIVRIGGQSRNQRLTKFNIRNKRCMYSDQSIGQKRHEVKFLLSKIQSLNENLGVINEGQSLLNFEVFHGIIPKFSNSALSKFTKEQIIHWLFSGINMTDVNWRRRNENELKKQEVAGEVAEEIAEDMDEEILDDHHDPNIRELFEDVQIQRLQPIISVEGILERCRTLENQIRKLQNGDDAYVIMREETRLIYELCKTQAELDHLRYRLSQFTVGMEVSEPTFVDLTLPYHMDQDSRWQLYFHWLCIYVKESIKMKENYISQFKRKYKIYSDLRDMEDVQVMKQNLVIGMTTTGAARLRSSLQSLKSPVVIVEEAAEVLEAHIVTALTNYCRHLILIGDHQQLKPTTANFKIETQFRLGISLFERMVLNKIQCYTLNVQHRMKPEISSLICPMIYPHLKDHESVMNRPQIIGIEKSLYFIDHQHPEEMCSDNSKKNVHEARFLIQLARHLVLNNYNPENITILAAYLGQMFELMREKNTYKLLLQDVRIAVLDNYQGEESDIILLSLVRSNEEKKIGFLKIENRVCVALSRARNGFFIMGNMTQFAAASELWVQIKNTLEEKGAIGPHLSLQCQIHRHKFTQVQCAEDFLKISEGGCDLMCESLLKCGHICTRLCHVVDEEHIKYKCREKCNKVLCDDPDHFCTKFCFEECGPCYYKVEKQLACGHSVRMQCHIQTDSFNCTELVMTTLPCGHETNKPCHKDPALFRCPFPCETRVEPCGHACTYSCHMRDDPDHLEYKCLKPCEKVRVGCSVVKEEDRHKCSNRCHEECMECDIKIKKKRTVCSHRYDVACIADVDEIVCKKPCTKILPCTHKCRNKCNETCGNCEVRVEKVVPECGHKVKIECCLEPDRSKCSGECPRLLLCGHKCVKKCNQPCTEICKVKVDCSISSPCGHIIKKIPCYFQNTDDPETLFKYCTEKCNVVLKCNHTCSGTCGKCSQGRAHVRCQEKCGVPLICNHECQVACRQNCRPCNQMCSYHCGHSKCGRPCGVPCTPCKERCRRTCQHQSCKRNCGAICNVPPCTKHCDKKMEKCGHPCVGLCGDPCPNLCRICDNEELTEILLGNENEEDAIYIMLEDCKHIFECSDLDKWMGLDGNEIKAKVCPRCQTTIKRSQRYNEILRRNMQDLVNVKKRSFGTEKDNKEKQAVLLEKLKEMNENPMKYSCVTQFKGIIESLNGRLSSTKFQNKQKRRQEINRMDLQAVDAKIQILEMIFEVFQKNELINVGVQKSSLIVDFILRVLMRDENSITDQEIDDVTMEIYRLSRCSQFEKIQVVPQYSYLYSNKSDVRRLADEIEYSIHNKNRYNMDQDDQLHNQLEEFKTLVGSQLKIIYAERREVVGALKLQPGHWFKCRNNHPFIITECGGAVQESICNECGVPIGGRDYQLLHGSRRAGEMDVSRYPY